MRIFRDTGHLFRFAGIFVVAILAFLGIRGFLVPKSFGQYGHYRGAALGEIAAHQANLPDTRRARPATPTSPRRRAGKHAP